MVVNASKSRDTIHGKVAIKSTEVTLKFLKVPRQVVSVPRARPDLLRCEILVIWSVEQLQNSLYQSDLSVVV